jgi:DNA ligase-1
MELFARTCDALSNESSSLRKVEIISESLKQIAADKELQLFCVYLTGVVYPAYVQKTINVGQAFIRDAVINLLGISKEEWNEAYSQFGELGEATEFLMQRFEKTTNSDPADLFSLEGALDPATSSVSTKVSLSEFEEYIAQLNQNSSSLMKVSIISDLLNRLTSVEAKFATKLLSGRMRIGVQEATVEDAIAKTYDVDKKLVKKMNFYLGDIGEVARRCKEHDFGNLEFKLFHPIKAMLASAEVDIEEIFKRMGDQVWLEYKYDGIRAHIHKQGNQVEIFTRDQKNITAQFPEVAESMKQFDHSFLIDGEIVPFRDDKIQAFADLQKRLGRKEKLDEAVRDNPTRFVAYDFLYLDGEVLFDKPLKERREMLYQIFDGNMMFSSQKIVATPKEFTEFFVQSKTEGREGLMVKNPASKYESGKRGIHWLKYKQTLDPLDVVVLMVEYGEGKNARYLSNYTFGVWDEKHENLVPVGRVYSGATEEDLKHFTEYMPTIATEQIERGYKLEPKVIFEVGFENIQKSERHGAGYAVRFPRILRIRTGDKPLDEISTIEDVKRGWEKLNGTETPSVDNEEN